MAAPSQKRIRVERAGKYATVPDDPNQIRLAMRQGWLPINEQGTPDRGLIGKTWDAYTRGLISPETVLKLMSGGKLQSQQDVARAAYGGPIPGETPEQAFNRVFSTTMAGKMANLVSGLTSPSYLSTEGLAAAAQLPKTGGMLMGIKAPGAVGKTARGLLSGQGILFGGKGIWDVLSNIGKLQPTFTSDSPIPYFNPEALENVLSGGSQAAAMAPAVTQAYRGISDAALSKMMPRYFARERSAFMAAMAPGPKEQAALHDAYDLLEPELKQANIKNFYEQRDFAEKQRRAIAAENMSELMKRNPNAGMIDPKGVRDAVRGRITFWMKLRTSPKGVMPAEARIISREARNIEYNLSKRPISIVEAENIVQDLNAELTKFRKLPPTQQLYMVRRGDPEGVMTAVKGELQNQIEAQFSGYKDLKARYGAYKEIQTQTERRIDQIDKALGGHSWADRRAAESAGSALGAIFSGEFLRGFAEIMAGRVAGDLAHQALSAPDVMLRRAYPRSTFLRPGGRLPFGVQALQPLAEQNKPPDTETIMNQLLGRPQQ